MSCESCHAVPSTRHIIKSWVNVELSARKWQKTNENAQSVFSPSLLYILLCLIQSDPKNVTV